jgi:hypothetical protein
MMMAGLMASVIFLIKEVCVAVDEGTGEIPGEGTADSGSGCEYWFNELPSAPLNTTYTSTAIVMTPQMTATFLIRRRRFFASICCLYLSGRYAAPGFLGFLFTSTASDDY